MIATAHRPELARLRNDIAFAEAIAERDASQSLVGYLANVVIDSRPKPRRWGGIWEPWQGEIVAPMVKAVEYATGIREAYAGPRRFWIELTRGHDKTGLIARLANFMLRFSRQQVTGIAAASDRDQARVLLTAMEREIALNPWLAAHLSAHNYFVRGPGGSVEVIASDAGGASGGLPDVTVCDEVTYWPRRDLFDMLLSGVVKRPQGVFIVITNAGIRGTWQWEIREAVRKDPSWHFYAAPQGRRLASWMSEEEIASDRAKMTTGHARRVFDNVWTDSSDNPLFPADLVAACSQARSSILWANPLQPPTGPKNLLLGYDVGQNDRAALWVLERTAPRTYVTRVLEVTQKVSLHDQEARLRAIIRAIRHRLVAGQIDQGSIGYQVAETLSREFPGLIVPISCGPQWQGRAALAVHLAGRERRLILPGLETGDADPQLVADFGQVEQVGDRKDGTPEVSTLRTDAGHADRFWGLAIAMDADAQPSRPQAKGARTG